MASDAKPIGKNSQFLRSVIAPTDCNMARHEPTREIRAKKFIECQYLSSSKTAYEEVVYWIVLALSLLILGIIIYFLGRKTIKFWFNQQLRVSVEAINQTRQANVQICGLFNKPPDIN